jgi:hypothetical protein
VNIKIRIKENEKIIFEGKGIKGLKELDKKLR